MNLQQVFFALLLHFQIDNSNTEKITYMSTERPKISWFDPGYFKNVTLFTRRHSRRDPRYYVGLYAQTYFTVTNSFKMEFYFYQFLTNRYRPSFVEMHSSFCDMLKSDVIFGHAIRNAIGGKYNNSCPFPPGIYDLQNMTIPFVPKGFPFNKGRIYCNASISEGGSSRLIGMASIDMEVKVAKI